MNDVLTETSANQSDTSLQQKPTHETATQPPILETYQGTTNKMDVLNNGLNSREQAVPFQLKEGTQGFSFVLNVDPKNDQRLINLDNLEDVSRMTDAEFASNAIIQQVDDQLSILRPGEEDTRITQESLKDRPYVIRLNGTTGVEVIDFDPAKNSIVLHKVKLAKLLPPIIPPIAPSAWRRRLVDFVGPLVIGTALIAGTADKLDIGGIPNPPSPSYVETVPDEIQWPKDNPTTERDPSLQCEKTEEVTMKEGDFLTKLLVDKNGWGRYLDTKGNINIPKMYEDLACMLSLPENQEVLKRTDPPAAAFISNVFDEKTIRAVGQPTAESIYRGLSALNTARGGSSDQLAINQPGDTLKVPVFK